MLVLNLSGLWGCFSSYWFPLWWAIMWTDITLLRVILITPNICFRNARNCQRCRFIVATVHRFAWQTDNVTLLVSLTFLSSVFSSCSDSSSLCSCWSHFSCLSSSSPCLLSSFLLNSFILWLLTFYSPYFHTPSFHLILYIIFSLLLSPLF